MNRFSPALVSTGGSRSIRTIILAAVLLQGACASDPPVPFRMFPDALYEQSTEFAYLWTSGFSKQPFLALWDYATITRIDDVETPSKYLPVAGSEPFVAWLLEVPVGEHVVEILNKEMTLLCGYFGCLTMEVSRHSIEFLAEENRIYTPFVGDLCSKKWFWIEDTGPYVPEMEALRGVAPPTDGMTVVAGTAPDYISCEGGETQTPARPRSPVE